jgi:hypothetical protein
MRDIRRAAARLAGATAGLLTLMCTGCQDSNAPVDWLSAVPGTWSGDLQFIYDDRGWVSYGFACGTLSATIEAAPDGQLSGSWTSTGCGSYSGTLAGTITGQTVTFSLTTSQGFNLFQKVSEYGACIDDPVTAASSATGTISRSDYDGTVSLGLSAEASLSFVADPFPGFSSPVCVITSGAWRWYASRAP